LLQGVLVGAIISIVLLIRRASTPHVAFLGRIPGSRRYSDISRHDSNEPTPGILAFRIESSIIYFNSDHILDSVLARIDSADEPVRFVVCDLSTSPHVDMMGADMLRTLHTELAKRSISLCLVEARASVRDMLRVEGIEDRVGRIDRFTSLADAMDALQGAGPPKD
jgi:MFS superfamily sulfate permease-like transporter